MGETLRIAVQKNGRLSEKSTSLFRKCGISISNGTGKLKTLSTNFPLEVLYLRDDDIPSYVADGVADAGIVGQNVIREKQIPVQELLPLGFAKCRISLAVRREDDYHDLGWFSGKRVATSYPHILEAFFSRHGIKATVEEISGSVEIAPGIGLADGICDVVSTGSTLFSNGLKEVEQIMVSEATLIATPVLSGEKRAILDRLNKRIQSVLRASRYKYILLNAPNDQIEAITNILPGMKSPSVLPLAVEGWSSLHSVIEEDAFWEIIDKLKGAGAEGILVCPIEKMIL